MSANVLSARDVNTSAPNSSGVLNIEDSKPKSLEYHRQVLQSRMNEDESKRAYVSPSDNIMSPCTAKLSAMKNKHFMKAKPQSLFAKASTKNATAASGPALPADKTILGGRNSDEPKMDAESAMSS